MRPIRIGLVGSVQLAEGCSGKVSVVHGKTPLHRVLSQDCVAPQIARWHT